MSPRSSRTALQTVPLTLCDEQLNWPAFLLKPAKVQEPAQLARSLASAFLKYVEPEQAQDETASVNEWLRLAQLHKDLTLEIQQFTHRAAMFVADGQPLEPLLLNFAAYRLEMASTAYELLTRQNATPLELENAMNLIRQRQQEYERILQCQ